MQLAEVWGVPPWVIFEHPGGLRWAAWRNVLQDALKKSRDLDKK